jgi:parallel beta-helix repeat protein
MRRESMLKFGRAVVAAPIAAMLAILPVATGSHASEILVPEDYGTIQAALDVAVSGDMVSVAPGVYPENIRFKSSGVTLYSRTRHAATIQGDGTAHVVAFNPGSGAVEGFVITGSGNSGTSDAGVFTSRGQPVIKHNLITGNYEGIIISGDSVAWIEANRIEGNGPVSYQSGIRVMTGAGGTIVNNLIAGSGRGISVDHTSGVEIINNSFVDNMKYGMVIGLGNGISSVRNNIVTGSEYGIYAGGGFDPDRSGYVGQFLMIDYNLFWGNSVSDYYAGLFTYVPDGSAGGGGSNSGPFDPLPGTSEVYADPLLDSVTGYELSAGSAAIDAGDNAICPETDLDGHLRPFDGNDPPDGFADCDIGSVEYLPEPHGSVMLIAGAVFLILLYRRRVQCLQLR